MVLVIGLTENRMFHRMDDNCVYFIDSGEGSVFVGRYVNIASGTTIKAHFVYAMIEDHSRYVEFIVSGTME